MSGSSNKSPGKTLTRARGRPRRSAEHEQQQRDVIVAAAKRLFAQEGFEAVSIRRIADEAGCGAMTLYGYFRSKNEILRFIWEDFFATLFRRIQRAAQRGSPLQRLRRAATAYLDYWCEHPEHYRMVYLNQDRTAEDERYYVDDSSVIERFTLFRELIAAMQADGSACDGDPQALTEALICALIGLSHALITIPEYRWQPRARLLEHTLRIVTR